MLWILKYDNGYTKCIKPLQALYFLLKVWYNVISFSLGKPVHLYLRGWRRENRLPKISNPHIIAGFVLTNITICFILDTRGREVVISRGP